MGEGPRRMRSRALRGRTRGSGAPRAGPSSGHAPLIATRRWRRPPEESIFDSGRRARGWLHDVARGAADPRIGGVLRMPRQSTGTPARMSLPFSVRPDPPPALVHTGLLGVGCAPIPSAKTVAVQAGWRVVSATSRIHRVRTGLSTGRPAQTCDVHTPVDEFGGQRRHIVDGGPGPGRLTPCR